MKYIISGILVGLTLASVAFFVFWVNQANPVKIQENFIIGAPRSLKTFCDSNVTRSLNIASLSLLGFWTLFWHIGLLGILKWYRNIEKRDAFLFQQALIVQLLSYGFILVITLYLFVDTVNLDNLQSAINLSNKVNLLAEALFSTLFSQELIFGCYVTMSCYMAYRGDCNHSLNNISTLYKCAFFVIALGAPYIIPLAASTNLEVSITVLCILCLSTLISTVFWLVMFKRSGRPIHQLYHDTNKLHLRTLWIFITLDTIYAICTAIFCSNLQNFLRDTKSFWTSKDVMIFDQILPYKDKLLLEVMLLCPMLCSLCTILFDPLLRRAFTVTLALPQWCAITEQCYYPNEEREPLLGGNNTQGTSTNQRYKYCTKTSSLVFIRTSKSLLRLSCS